MPDFVVQGRMWLVFVSGSLEGASESLEVLSDRSVFVIHGGSLGSFRVGLAMLKRPNHVIRGLGI